MGVEIPELSELRQGSYCNKYQTEWTQSLGHSRSSISVAPSVSVCPPFHTGTEPRACSCLTSVLLLTCFLGPIFTFYFMAESRLPRLALNSFCTPDSLWTCDPPVSASGIAQITGLCHQSQQLLYPIPAPHLSSPPPSSLLRMLHSPAHVSFWGIVCRSSPETGYATVCSHFMETPCRRLAFISILHITDEPGLWPVSSILRMETREPTHWLSVFSSKVRTLCYSGYIKGCMCVHMCLKRNICWAPTICHRLLLSHLVLIWLLK